MFMGDMGTALVYLKHLPICSYLLRVNYYVSPDGSFYIQLTIRNQTNSNKPQKDIQSNSKDTSTMLKGYSKLIHSFPVHPFSTL